MEMTEHAYPIEEATMLFTGASLAGGGSSSLGTMPTFKEMMDCKVELF